MEDNLVHELVEVGVGRALDVQVTVTDIIDGLLVYPEGIVQVLQGGMGGKDAVTNCFGHLRGWVDSKLQLGFLATVNGKLLHQQRGEVWASVLLKATEDQETLKPGILVCLG